MRGILIAVVLGLTALTFYSALWFKSETIERDITDRVTQNLDETGAKDIGIDVDGRHVTLSGIVYDAQVEAAHLETADTTYGALGPIDGLTYLQDGGYILASKTDSGITLRGTVPNEDTRAALLASAADATDGEVADELTIAGPVAGWQEEASFGLGQLAGLTSGTLTAAAGAYALSGVADQNAGAVRDAVSGRDGWQAFVSAPQVTSNLSNEVARLTGEVASQGGTITGLQGDIAALQGVNADLTQERDALGVKLEGLRSSMTEGETDVADLRERLTAAQSDIDTATGEIQSRDATIADLTGRVTTAEGQATAAQGSVADLTQQADGMTARIAELETELANRQVALGSTGEQVSALSSTVGDLNSVLSQRDAQIAELTQGISTRETAVAALTAQVAQTQGSLDTLTADLADRDANLATLTANLADRDATIASLRSQTPAAAPVASTIVSNAAQCAARAGQVMEGAQINFATATATIEDDSVELLERMTGIALACVGDDLTVEVGGHTDNQGSNANNQALSEARAQAVVAFMATRGVPTDGLQAVGYGEGRPIAGNDTSEGRAQNRRISFDWQPR